MHVWFKKEKYRKHLPTGSQKEKGGKKVLDKCELEGKIKQS